MASRFEEGAGIKISIESPDPTDSLLGGFMSGGDQNRDGSTLTYSYHDGFGTGYSSTTPHSQAMSSSSPGYPSSLALPYGPYRIVQPEIPSPASSFIDSPLAGSSDFSFSPLFANPPLDGATAQYTDPTALQTQVDNDLSQGLSESMLLHEVYKYPSTESSTQDVHGFDDNLGLDPLNFHDYLSGDQTAPEFRLPYHATPALNVNTTQAGPYAPTGIPVYLSPAEPLQAIDPSLLDVPPTFHQRHSYSEGVDPGSSRRLPPGVDELRRVANEARSAPTTPDYPPKQIDDSAVDDEWYDQPQSAASSSHHGHIVKQTIVSDTMRQASEARRTTAATFHCDVSNCGASFTRNSSLKRHMNSHTRKMTYPCPTCGRMFVNSSDRRRHQQTKHDKPKIKASGSRSRRLTIKKE